MLVSCLLPTFNRFSNHLAFLVNEAVQSFLIQDYPDRELIICNDTPNQLLHFNHPQVKVYNLSERFPTLGNKLQWMISQAQGDYLCRWDDDDLSLPWRIKHSVGRLFKVPHPTVPFHEGDALTLEWRPENHWFYRSAQDIQETRHPGNTHVMAIWHRDIIADYPGEPCPSGLEDQTYNTHLWKLGYPRFGNLLDPRDIFYIYRWGTGSQHLSGAGGGNIMQHTYDKIGNYYVAHGNFKIEPVWQRDYIGLCRRAAEKLLSQQPVTV